MVEFCFETINWSPTVGFERPDFPRMINAAVKNGFQWISFDLPTIRYFLKQGGSLDMLKIEMDMRGLKTLAVHSLRIDGETANVEVTANEAVGYCQILGARYLNSCVIAPVGENVIDSTRRAGIICRDAGIQFAMEIFAFLPVNSILAIHDLLRAAQITGPSIVFDSWHFFMGPDDWRTLANLDVEEIAYVQFSDHVAVVSEDLPVETIHKRLMPGDGDLDLGRFARFLKDIGYDGIVGPEILSRESRQWPIEAYAVKAMECTRRYWN